MRVREPPKGILRVFVQFQFILPTKKNKSKRQVCRNTQKQCGEEAQKENKA